MGKPVTTGMGERGAPAGERVVVSVMVKHEVEEGLNRAALAKLAVHAQLLLVLRRRSGKFQR